MKNKGYIWIALIFSGIAFISWNDTLTVVLACMSIAAGFLAIKSGEKYQLIAVLGSGFSIFVLLMLLFRSEEYITVPAEKMLDLKKAEMLREEAHASGNMDEYTEFVLGYIMDEDSPYELRWVNAAALLLSTDYKLVSGMPVICKRYNVSFPDDYKDYALQVNDILIEIVKSKQSDPLFSRSGFAQAMISRTEYHKVMEDALTRWLENFDETMSAQEVCQAFVYSTEEMVGYFNFQQMYPQIAEIIKMDLK